MSTHDPYLQLVNARLEALSSVFGEPAATDIIRVYPNFAEPVTRFARFDQHLDNGSVYVTTIMTGRATKQIPASLGNYELAICLTQDESQWLDLIAQTLALGNEVSLDEGMLMQFDEPGDDDAMAGLLFCHPDDMPVSLSISGHRATVLQAVGVTAAEISFQAEHGSAKLLEALKTHGIFPMTISDRESVSE